MTPKQHRRSEQDVRTSVGDDGSPRRCGGCEYVFTPREHETLCAGCVAAVLADPDQWWDLFLAPAEHRGPDRWLVRGHSGRGTRTRGRGKRK